MSREITLTSGLHRLLKIWCWRISKFIIFGVLLLFSLSGYFIFFSEVDLGTLTYCSHVRQLKRCITNQWDNRFWQVHSRNICEIFCPNLKANYFDQSANSTTHKITHILLAHGLVACLYTQQIHIHTTVCARAPCNPPLQSVSECFCSKVKAGR